MQERSAPIAYLMSRFPKPTETFILYEMLALEDLGLPIEVFALIREDAKVVHPGAQELVDRAHFSRFFSLPVLAAQLAWFLKRPLRYLSTWWQVLWGNLPSPSFLLRALVVMPQAALFARKMESLGVRHLHVHWATHPALAAYIIRRLSGIPYSFTCHAHDIFVDRTMLEKKIADASFVVTISEFNRRLLESEYGETATRKIHIIHCGVDGKVFQANAEQQKSDVFSILCIGSLEIRKGQNYLIDACARLKEKGVEFRCNLVGDGPSRQAFEAQSTAAGLDDYVTFLGHQPRPRVAELLAESNVMVLPAIVDESGRTEGIPVALMESMATEAAVISSAISGIPELIEDGRTGFLVPEADPEALTEAIMKLYEDPELGPRFGAAGREKVLKEFDLYENTRALHRLLLETMGEAKGEDAAGREAS